ncbi:amino acid adenylation domain-containing protein [Streptomyces sp. NPDC127190]|uniref:non-ribosomal peptide synthetase n=1 Tax=unclassified Streptomyces TaxID=2593676 RepID=UPI00363F62D4
MKTPNDVGNAQVQRLPLTHGQEQLWFLDRLHPHQPVYNVPLALRVRGPLDPARLRAAADRVVARHEALRVSFPETDGGPVQLLAPPAPAHWEEKDAGAGELDHLLAAEAARPFSLRAGPLHRFLLLRLGPHDHVLSLVFHHIVVDGTSLGLVVSDLLAFYRDGSAAEEPAPSWSAWVRRRREEVDEAGELAAGLDFWENRLAALPVPELPADRLRGSAPSTSGDHVRQVLPPALVSRLRQLARSRRVSLFVVLAAAVNVLVSRYTGEDDIPLGVPLGERGDPEAEGVVGHFVNMVVFRTDLSDDPSFGELLDRVLDQTIDLHDFGWVPFERVVERLRPVREPGRNPLFQVSVQLVADPAAQAGPGLPDADIEIVTPRIPQSRFDLAVNFFEAGDRITLDLEYSTELFDGWRIEALARHLTAVLEAVAEDPGLRRSAVPLLTGAEREELLRAGTGDELPLPAEPLHVRIARTAARRGDAVAAVCGDEQIGYAELDRRADRLARRLRGAGLRAGDVVAVLLEKDLDALVAELAVLKAGGAFAVLDPAQPRARLGLLLADAGARVLITRDRLRDAAPPDPDRVTLLVDDPRPAADDESDADGPLPEWATEHSAAYVLYTSGSTGKPKGVVVEHAALTCFVEGYRKVFPFGPEDRLLQFSALTFDMAQGEIFTALTVGATLVLVPADTARSPGELAALMRESEVTYAGLMPALLALLEPEPYPRLRHLMAGGDVLAAELVNKWNLPGRTMVNMYGPTEAAVACAHHVCAGRTWTTVPPIGRPQHNRLLYVVDRWGNLVPRGVPGELLVGGPAGLARGYLGAPELTDERFVPDVWGPGERVYRTGDLVSWNAEHALEFHGRRDHQVKLNGLRIEPGEIESALLRHPAVTTAAVVLHTSADGAKRLVGYVGTPEPAALDTARLRRLLVEAVPAYMIPSAWVLLGELPLTSSGKVDRRRLPEPGPEPDTARAEGGQWGSELESRVAGIFSEVLDGAEIRPGQGFFDLGGTSFQAMRVVGRIHKQLGAELSTRTLYAHPTVEDVTAEVARLLGAPRKEGASDV